MIGIYLSGTGNTKHCVEKLVNLLDDTARLLKKYGAEILGGLQIKMPDSVCDSKLLKKVLKKTDKLLRMQTSG